MTKSQISKTKLNKKQKVTLDVIIKNRLKAHQINIQGIYYKIINFRSKITEFLIKRTGIYLLIVMNILLSTTNSNAMPKNLSKTEEQIKNLIPKAESGNSEAMEKAYQIALNDKKYQN